jgi:hypothetical protein
MNKKFTTIFLVCLLYGINCFGQAPTISYPATNVFYLNSIPVLTPTITGGPASNFTVSPALPAGLVLDPQTGTLSATDKLRSVSPPVDYTISAKFSARHDTTITCKTNIAIADPSLPKIVYNTPNAFVFGAAIPTLAPTITGGTVSGYAITPKLDSLTGLKLDTITGIITGIAKAIQSDTNYVVTAHTPVGDRFANIEISVIPRSLYKPLVIHGTIGEPITSMMPPDGDDKHTVYSVKLPQMATSWLTCQTHAWRVREKIRRANKELHGLRLNQATGEISGTPTKAWLWNDTIIATPSNGKNPKCCIVNFKIDPLPDSVSIPPQIEFVGQGDIQQSLNTGAKIGANTGIGIIFRQNSSRRYGILHNIEVELSVNVASTADTIKSTYETDPKTNMVTNKSDFGNSVLLPSNSGQAFSFSFTGYLTEKGGPNGNYQRNAAPIPLGGVLSGFKVAFAGSNRYWDSVGYSDNSATPPVRTTTDNLVKASLVSAYLGIFHEFFPLNKDTQYGRNGSITLGLGYTARWILGDAAQPTEDSLRTKLLGSLTKTFYGPEISLGLRFYNIKAEVHIPFLRKNNIPGLSGTQLTTFIGFSGGFPIDLKKPSGQ